MNKSLLQILDSIPTKTFSSINFGCRVNAAETNQLSQFLVDNGFTPCPVEGRAGEGFTPAVILVNTCAITKKGDIESLSRVRALHRQYPSAHFIVTGCANIQKLKDIPNVIVLTNAQKEDLLKDSDSFYSPEIKDKFSHTHRFILRIQTGCAAHCSYCIVPTRRPDLWSLPINEAIDTVNRAVKNGYQEIIITGVNLNQYQPGFSNLVEALLNQTSIPLISFGSVPLNCLDDKFISLFSTFGSRLSTYLHIPLQSGSDKILRLMRRPYTVKNIIDTFSRLKKISLVKGRNGAAERDFVSLGTDIIVGFPGETDVDYDDTYQLCRSLNFDKIHVFKFSQRPGTTAVKLYRESTKIPLAILKKRSQMLSQLSKTT